MNSNNNNNSKVFKKIEVSVQDLCSGYRRSDMGKHVEDISSSFPLLQLDEFEGTETQQPPKNYHKIIAIGQVADLGEYKAVLNAVSEKATTLNNEDLDHVLKAAALSLDSIASTKIAELERFYSRRKTKLRELKRSHQAPFCSPMLGLEEQMENTNPMPEVGGDRVQSVKKLHSELRRESLHSQTQQHRREMETALAFLRKDQEERAALEECRLERDQKVEMDLLRRDMTAFYDRQRRNLHLTVNSPESARPCQPRPSTNLRARSRRSRARAGERPRPACSLRSRVRSRSREEPRS
jgi:hypothetical protein